MRDNVEVVVPVDHVAAQDDPPGYRVLVPRDLVLMLAVEELPARSVRSGTEICAVCGAIMGP